MSADVTVIIPTYNRATYLKRAIESCFQGNDPLRVEVLVVDDGSTDGTSAYLAGISCPHVRCFSQTHRGPQIARNLGLSNASGEFVKFLDDDDWLTEGALLHEVNLLRTFSCDLSAGRVKTVTEDESLLEELLPPHEIDPLPELLRGSSLTYPLGFMMRSRLARQVQWQPSTKALQDAEYFWRIAMRAERYISTDVAVGVVLKHSGRRVTQSTRSARAMWHLRVLLTFLAEFHSNRGFHSPERLIAARDALWVSAHICLPRWPALSHEAWRMIEILSQTTYTPKRSTRALTFLDRLLTPIGTEYLTLPLRYARLAWRR